MFCMIDLPQSFRVGTVWSAWSAMTCFPGLDLCCTDSAPHLIAAGWISKCRSWSTKYLICLNKRDYTKTSINECGLWFCGNIRCDQWWTAAVAAAVQKKKSWLGALCDVTPHASFPEIMVVTSARSCVGRYLLLRFEKGSLFRGRHVN